MRLHPQVKFPFCFAAESPLLPSAPRMGRKILILTEGLSSPHSAKTACGVIRFRRDEVVGVLDSTVPPQPAQALLEVGGDLPVVNSLDALPEANVLLIGIAPSGGTLPAPMRALVLGAIERGMDVDSGLHEFLNDDPEFAAAAAVSGSTLRDLRRNSERDVARRQNISVDCLRIHTVGHDCSVGKMAVSIEVARGLAKRGVDAKFIATGQTGMLVEGDGCPVDAVVTDFISGAVEKQILAHQHHEVLVIEGQGSITHPCYSAVTLGLLHGCLPHGLIYCYEMGRKMAKGAAPRRTALVRVAARPLPRHGQRRPSVPVHRRGHQQPHRRGTGLPRRARSHRVGMEPAGVRRVSRKRRAAGQRSAGNTERLKWNCSCTNTSCP